MWLAQEYYEPKLSKKDESARDLVLYRKNVYLDYAKRNYHDRWDKFWMQYRSKLDNAAEYPYRARLFIPYSFTAVETAIPRMVEAVFSSEPIVAVKPLEEQDVPNAAIMELLLNYQLKRMDFIDTFIPLVKDCFIMGSCFAKVDWRKEYRNKKQVAQDTTIDEMSGQPTNMPMLDENGNYVLEKVRLPFYDDPYIYRIDPYKILLDPKANPIDPIGTSEAVIMITESTIPQLRELEKEGIFKNISEVVKVKGSSNWEQGEDRYADMDITKPSMVSDKHSNRVLLYEYWEDDRVIVLAEEKVVIRDEPNPYWHCRKPFVEARICPTHEIYGIGFMEMIEAMQHELNDKHNQRADNITLALNRMYIIARDADIDTELLLSEPGGIIMSNYPEGVQPLPQPDVTQSSFSEIADIEDNIDRTLGIHDPSRGKPTDRETATGVVALQEQANMRFKLMIMIFSKLLSKATDMMVDLNQQFLPPEKEFRITGGTTQRIAKIEEIVGRYDYEPVGATLEGLSKYARMQQLLQFRPMFADNPDFKKTEFDKKLMELLNFKDYNRYFMTEEEKMMKMQQAMMAQGMGAGMGGEMPPDMGGLQPPPPILPTGEVEYEAGAGRPPMILQ